MSFETEKNKVEEEGPSTIDDEIMDDKRTLLVAHVWNPDIDIRWRYGIPAFIVGNLIFLTIADVASGVVATTSIIDRQQGVVFDEIVLLSVSIVTSIMELWKAGSQPLAIFICLTSLLLPYFKLIFMMVAWVAPMANRKRRERFIQILDAISKWSFVDIFVLVIIMVAFRSTIITQDVVGIEVYILPQWGFYAFVFANMLSLVGSQFILRIHRNTQYEQSEIKKDSPSSEEDVEEVKELKTDGSEINKTSISSETGISRILLILLFFVYVSTHFVGCWIHIYQVINTRGSEVLIKDYSIFSLGNDIPLTVHHPSDFGVRWMQFMFFIITVVLPVCNIFTCIFLYLYPMTRSLQKTLFFVAEIFYSWSASEVIALSVAFSVLQIPKFGNGLIEGGCTQCYVVNSTLYSEFSIICFSAVLNMAINFWLLMRAHECLYPK